MGKSGHLGGTLSQAGLNGLILILALSAVTDLMAEVVFSESHKHTRSFFFLTFNTKTCLHTTKNKSVSDVGVHQYNLSSD